MSMDRLTAALADNYRIERELGQGGMGTELAARSRGSAESLKRPSMSGSAACRARSVSGLGADVNFSDISRAVALATSISVEVVRFLLTEPGKPRATLRPVSINGRIASLKWPRPKYAKQLKQRYGKDVDGAAEQIRVSDVVAVLRGARPDHEPDGAV